jgi:hypothetical protein
VPQVEKYAPLTLNEWIDKKGVPFKDLDVIGETNTYKEYEAYIFQHIAMNLTRIAVTHALVLEKLEMIATIMDEATTSEDDSGSG